MISIRLVWLGMCLVWIGMEIALVRKNHAENQILSARETRSQRILWFGVTGGVLAALVFKSLEWMPLPLPYISRQIPALLLFVGAVCFRYCAVAQLGRFFTTEVTISRDHRLIVEGPYRLIRHPAYSGLLLALLAAGIAMGDLLALLAITLPAFAAVCHRIEIEEAQLVLKFGQKYLDYKKVTRKLVPELF